MTTLSPMIPIALTTNRRTSPIGIDGQTIEFGWRLAGEPPAGYDVELRRPDGTEVWGADGIAVPDDCRTITYGGPALEPATRYEWRIRAHAGTEWSAWADFETGLLAVEDWAGAWITDDRETSTRRALYFHGLADLPADVVSARAYVSALGWYRFFVNGADITGPALVPRWTPLDHFVEYQSYDVTEHLVAGANSLAAVVGDGRYRGSLGFRSHRDVFGDRLALIAHLHVELTDGTTLRLGSGDGWTVGSGPIQQADPKHGQRVDLRLPDVAGQEALDARPAVPLPPHRRTLVSEELAAVQEVSRLSGTRSLTPSGVELIDFGQNFAGHVQVRLRGPEGAKVRISYSEVLTPAGELDVHYLDLFGTSKEWFQRDEIVLSRDATDYAPWFSVFGFRYVTIEPLDGATIEIERVEGVVMSTPLETTAQFETSREDLNRLWRNVEWSLRSNFLDTPTDCPTRERSGWTGDIQIFGPTASMMVDSDVYLRRYLRNLAVEQFDDGGVPTVIPREWSTFSGGKDPQSSFRSAVGWGDTAVMLPLDLYRHFNDVEVLRRQYPSARAWVEHLAQRARTSAGAARRLGRRVGELETYIVDTGMHYGEWLRPGESMTREMMKNAVRPPAQVATAYLANSARLLARTASILGFAEDAAHYENLSTKTREAYRAAFVRRGGSRIGVDKQDDYVRSLAFDLLEPDEVNAAFERLAQLIEKSDGHLATGFLSTPLLLSVLVDHGRSDLAYRILLQPTSPSWLAQLDRGATTVWETWEGYDRSGHAKMSHNHYAFGSVAGWMLEYIVGIRVSAPGYRRFIVNPTPGADLTHARGSLSTAFGTIESGWRLQDGVLTLDVTVPPGTEAVIRIAHVTEVRGPGLHQISTAWESSDAPSRYASSR